MQADDKSRLPREDICKTLEKCLERIESYQKNASGVQHNQHVIKLPHEDRFFAVHINNLGDPFCNPKVPLDPHSFPEERMVIAKFAELYGWDPSPSQTWGYVGNSGSEGNLSGIRYGREVIAQKYGVKDKTKITLLYSKASHYSVPRAGDLLNIRLKPLDTTSTDDLDIHKMRMELWKNIDFYRENGVVLAVTLGTTMTCAYDDFMSARRVLKELGIKKYFTHIDGALGGLIMPFFDNSNFQYVDSVAVSGHKILGLPFPACVFMTRKEHWELVQEYTPYISKQDGTLFGSRNGLAPLYLYVAVMDMEGKRERVLKQMDLTLKTVSTLNDAGVPAFCVPQGLAVCLPSIQQEPGYIPVQKKYKLADDGRMCHFFVMEQHLVKTNIVDDFVSDTCQYYQSRKPSPKL